jgi:hypothetical protein
MTLSGYGRKTSKDPATGQVIIESELCSHGSYNSGEALCGTMQLLGKLGMCAAATGQVIIESELCSHGLYNSGEGTMQLQLVATLHFRCCCCCCC